jgi:signal transduction histidine kinase
LVLLAGGFYALGQAWGRRALEAQLRSARQELHLSAELAESWRWASDAQHRLLYWQAPEPAKRSPQAADTGHGDDHQAQPGPAWLPQLMPRLQAQRRFTDAQFQTPARTSDPAGRHWRVCGSPRVNDAGQFDGFLGTARPLDTLRQAEATAACLAAVLRTSGCAVLAWREGAGSNAPGDPDIANTANDANTAKDANDANPANDAHEPASYVLQLLSPAAQAACPGAGPGKPLDSLLRTLPGAVTQAVSLISGQPEGSVLEAGGWRLLRFGAGPGRTGLWLSRAADSAVGTSSSSEAEQFSMTVSHDLRAPIRVVEGFTRIVKEDYGRLLDRVGNDHLDRVLGAAARMNLMIDALLTLARLSAQPLARQPVNLSQLALYVVDDLRRSAPDRVADIEIEPDLAAHGDPTLLRLVLENLLGNAWKYTSKVKPARIVLRQVGSGSQRVFEVQDNGAGFDMRSSDRLFGLFQRLHSANDFPGHGVGLASVKRIVQRHGGDIWAEAEPGRGASFHFTLAP